MRVLIYGLMAIALSLAGVLMGVHHSGAEVHAGAAAVSHSVTAHTGDELGHEHGHAAHQHDPAAAIPDAHPAGATEECATCGHHGDSLLLMACAFLAVLVSLAALFHPARHSAPVRRDELLPPDASPPHVCRALADVDLDTLCISRR